MKNVHKTAKILKEKLKSLFRLLGFITTWAKLRMESVFHFNTNH